MTIFTVDFIDAEMNGVFTYNTIVDIYKGSAYFGIG